MYTSLWLLPLLPATWGLRIPVQESKDVSAQSAWEWSDCSSPDSYFQVNTLQISPDPPAPGQTHNITLNGHLSSEVTEGAYADVNIKLGMIKIVSRTFEICDVLKERGSSEQCPIKAGSIEIKDTFDLPKEIPPGKFTVSLKAYTVDEQDLACADIRVDFSKKPSRMEL